MKVETLTEVQEPKTKVTNKIKPIIQEEKQVIVHCSMPCEWGMGVRIWKSTYLVTEDGTKIPLVFWEGVSLAPIWTRIEHNGFYNFTLIFNGLPKECKVFALTEEIPEPGGFLVEGIMRNKKDVYKVLI